MNFTLPLILAAGLAAHPVFAQTQPELPAAGTAAGQAERGYGIATGGGNGLRAEAGADRELAQFELEMPRPLMRGDITYLCGGIGQTEARYMHQQARHYDLKLTFASQTGAYLADVDVDIRNAQGESVLQVKCDAPIMLVDFPRSGAYRVHADAAGFTQIQTVRVNADSGQRVASVAITWPQQIVAQMEPGPAPMVTGGALETTGGQAVGAPEGARPEQGERSGDAGGNR
jgi:hypothetical protein